MRKSAVWLLIILTILLISTSVSCEHNVYLDGEDTWQTLGYNFGTFSHALSYLMAHVDELDTCGCHAGGLPGSSEQGEAPWNRTIYLIRDVGEDERGEAIVVPEDYNGEHLHIDFNGHEYWFRTDLDRFFDIRGGSTVDIIGGKTVITEDTPSRAPALHVGVRTVTIADHIIDDRRTDPVAVEIDAGGSLVIASPSGIRTDIMVNGTFHIQEGGTLKITDGCVCILDINDINAQIPGSLVITGGKIIVPHKVAPIILRAIPEECVDNVEIVFIHTWEKKWETLIRPSTCHEEGEVCVHYECTECEAEYDEFYYLPKLHHVEVWSNDRYYHWATCALCGDVLEPKEVHTFITVGGITYCIVCGYVQEEGGGVQSGFDVTVEDLIPAGYLTASDMDPETMLYTITLTTTNPESEPDHFRWYIDDNLVEGATGTSIQAQYRYESFNVMCIFWNEKGTGSASVTLQ